MGFIYKQKYLYTFSQTRNMRITKELAQDYFETMVNLQPEDIVTILMDLYSGKLSQATFVDNITNDIIDVNRD